MEEKISRQILSAFADSRLNTSHLAWMVKLGVTKDIDEKLKEFFYYYHTFKNQDTDDNDAAWMGEKMMNQLKNPVFESFANPPPPGTRIVFADE